MKSLAELNTAVIHALNMVNRARNSVGSLHLYTSPNDGDINHRVTDAFDQIARAEGILEALRDALDVWIKEEGNAREES